MVVAKPCTPWSNLKCIHQNSGTQASWEAPVPREPVPASPEPPTVPLHPQGAGGLVWPVAVGCCLLLVVPLMTFLCWKHILPGEAGEGRGRHQHPLPPLHPLLCFSRGQGPPLGLPNLLSLVPHDHPPSPTSPGLDHTSPSVCRLMVASAWVGRPALQLFRAPVGTERLFAPQLGDKSQEERVRALTQLCSEQNPADSMCVYFYLISPSLAPPRGCPRVGTATTLSPGCPSPCPRASWGGRPSRQVLRWMPLSF